MKFFKHTFEIVEGYRLEGEELVPNVYTDTCYFALDNAGQRIFEEEYGKGMIQAMQENQAEIDALNPKLIRALATATYKDLNSLSNADANAIKFKESPAYMACPTDIEFVVNLITMVTEALFGTPEEQKTLPKQKGSKSSKK